MSDQFFINKTNHNNPSSRTFHPTTYYTGSQQHHEQPKCQHPSYQQTPLSPPSQPTHNHSTQPKQRGKNVIHQSGLNEDEHLAPHQHHTYQHEPTIFTSMHDSSTTLIPNNFRPPLHTSHMTDTTLNHHNPLSHNTINNNNNSSQVVQPPPTLHPSGFYAHQSANLPINSEFDPINPLNDQMSGSEAPYNPFLLQNHPDPDQNNTTHTNSPSNNQSTIPPAVNIPFYFPSQDKDAFLSYLYKYYLNHGYNNINAAAISNLVTTLFAILFTSMFFIVFDWTTVYPCFAHSTGDLDPDAHDPCEIIKWYKLNFFAYFTFVHFFVLIYFLSLSVYWVVQVFRAFQDLRMFKHIKRLLYSAQISDHELSHVSWSFIIYQLNRTYVTTCEQTVLYNINKDYIAQKIMKYDNILIYLLKKKNLAHFTLPSWVEVKVLLRRIWRSIRKNVFSRCTSGSSNATPYNQRNLEGDEETAFNSPSTHLFSGLRRRNKENIDSGEYDTIPSTTGGSVDHLNPHTQRVNTPQVDQTSTSINIDTYQTHGQYDDDKTDYEFIDNPQINDFPLELHHLPPHTLNHIYFSPLLGWSLREVVIYQLYRAVQHACDETDLNQNVQNYVNPTNENSTLAPHPALTPEFKTERIIAVQQQLKLIAIFSFIFLPIILFFQFFLLLVQNLHIIQKDRNSLSTSYSFTAYSKYLFRNLNELDHTFHLRMLSVQKYITLYFKQFTPPLMIHFTTTLQFICSCWIILALLVTFVDTKSVLVNSQNRWLLVVLAGCTFIVTVCKSYSEEYSFFHENLSDIHNVKELENDPDIIAIKNEYKAAKYQKNVEFQALQEQNIHSPTQQPQTNDTPNDTDNTPILTNNFADIHNKYPILDIITPTIENDLKNQSFFKHRPYLVFSKLLTICGFSLESLPYANTVVMRAFWKNILVSTAHTWAATLWDTFLTPLIIPTKLMPIVPDILDCIIQYHSEQREFEKPNYFMKHGHNNNSGDNSHNNFSDPANIPIQPISANTHIIKSVPQYPHNQGNEIGTLDEDNRFNDETQHTSHPGLPHNKVDFDTKSISPSDGDSDDNSTHITHLSAPVSGILRPMPHDHPSNQHYIPHHNKSPSTTNNSRHSTGAHPSPLLSASGASVTGHHQDASQNALLPHAGNSPQPHQAFKPHFNQYPTVHNAATPGMSFTPHSGHNNLLLSTLALDGQHQQLGIPIVHAHDDFHNGYNYHTNNGSHNHPTNTPFHTSQPHPQQYHPQSYHDDIVYGTNVPYSPPVEELDPLMTAQYDYDSPLDYHTTASPDIDTKSGYYPGDEYNYDDHEDEDDDKGDQYESDYDLEPLEE